MSTAKNDEGVVSGMTVPLEWINDIPDEETAQRIQEAIRKRCILKRTIDTGSIKSVAGADVAYSARDTAYAVTVVMSFSDARFIEAACSVGPAGFPYIPGLFAFREGLACHLGIALGIPVIGVAGNLLTGVSEDPGPSPGSTAPVIDAGEVVGMAVRTKTNAKPVYVSAGHYVDLGQAVEIVLATTTVHRFPKSLYEADQISRSCRNSDKDRNARRLYQSLF